MEDLTRDVAEQYQLWLESPAFDRDTKEELRALTGNNQEITDRFYRDLEFGTGGLRGILGAGSNRMNIYTVRKATQGLANYINKEKEGRRGVAIAYDSRRMSFQFAREAALCLAANGIKAYVFESLRPTPELSFALRRLGCIAGIVVTASHNPPEYNGYKVYWEDGAQITAPKDKEIIGEVNAITDYAMALTMDLQKAKDRGLYQVIGKEVDDCYMEELKKLVIHPEVIRQQGKDMKIVYTPLHGTGNLPVRRILAELGFENVYVVSEQELPDGDFPTVSYPNPEDKNAFTLALKLAGQVDADVVLATDPDADRLGIYAKNRETGEYEPFTGNMSGMIILEYMLSQKQEAGQIPTDGAVVTTIVSGKMSRRIAEEYQVDRIETLTGFKYIGEQIKFFEQDHRNEFLFGYEESYGCLVGTHARDKDAVVAVMALCEAAAYYRSQGLTLCQQMERLYEKYGYFHEGLCTITMKGQEGAEKIRDLLERIRKEPPSRIGGYRVEKLRDYDKEIIRDCATRKEKPSGLPKSNVLYFDLEGDAWCCIRPSGTEPKVKFYMGVKGESRKEAEKKLEELTEAVRGLAG
ncbi:MAG: phospho-sugar mutase [Lachnospiraceae bacterium]|nr:phospho-sugar mutase [Lachnospiraceae bacterium]